MSAVCIKCSRVVGLSCTCRAEEEAESKAVSIRAMNPVEDAQDPATIVARYNKLGATPPPEKMEIHPGSVEWMDFFMNAPLDTGVLIELVRAQAEAWEAVQDAFVRMETCGACESELAVALAKYASDLARARRVLGDG